MGIISRLFGKTENKAKTGGMEDFMTLVRVYFQASIAANIGITNLAMLPDLRTFKTTLKVPTLGNKLGMGEKTHCKRMMQELYSLDDEFFKEIDKSIKKNCHKIQDVQTYLIQFQNFCQDLLMLVGNVMKFKLRLPSFFKGMMKVVLGIRQYQKRLGFSQDWISNFVYHVVMLAKKEPKPSDEGTNK